MNFKSGDKHTNRHTQRHIALALVELLLSQLKNILVLGSKIYRLGTSAPRQPLSPADPTFPFYWHTLGVPEEPVTVVQKNGIVTRMMKLIKLRGYVMDYPSSTISIHVNEHLSLRMTAYIFINCSVSNLHVKGK